MRLGVITIDSGEAKGNSFYLSDGQSMVLGRGSGVDLLLPESYPHVSRKHCTIAYDADRQRFYVMDTSSGGIFKENGERLGKEAYLSEETILWLGDNGCVVLLGGMEYTEEEDDDATIYKRGIRDADRRIEDDDDATIYKRGIRDTDRHIEDDDDATIYKRGYRGTDRLIKVAQEDPAGRQKPAEHPQHQTPAPVRQPVQQSPEMASGQGKSTKSLFPIVAVVVAAVVLVFVGSLFYSLSGNDSSDSTADSGKETTNDTDDSQDKEESAIVEKAEEKAKEKVGEDTVEKAKEIVGEDNIDDAVEKAKEIGKEIIDAEITEDDLRKEIEAYAKDELVGDPIVADFNGDGKKEMIMESGCQTQSNGFDLWKQYFIYTDGTHTYQFDGVECQFLWESDYMLIPVEGGKHFAVTSNCRSQALDGQLYISAIYGLGETSATTYYFEEFSQLRDPKEGSIGVSFYEGAGSIEVLGENTLKWNGKSYDFVS